MTRAWVALIAWTLLPAASEARIAVISPTDNGLVVGERVRVVITGCKKAPKVEATLDGAPAPVTWERLAHRGRWMAWLALHGRTKKNLNLSGRCGVLKLKRAIRFSNRITSSVQVAEHVVERFFSMNKPRRLAWHWGPGIFLYGLSRLAERSTRRDRYVAYLREYHAHHLEKGTPTIDWADKCPPALSGLTLATRHGDPLALPAVEKVAAFLRTVPKNSLGSIDHLGHGTFLSLFYPSSIWVDSLMMWGVLAVAHGKHAGDPRLLDFGLGQPLIFSRTARDVRNGLFHHAWNVERQRPHQHPPPWIFSFFYGSLPCRRIISSKRRGLLRIYANFEMGTDPISGLRPRGRRGSPRRCPFRVALRISSSCEASTGSRKSSR